MLKKLSYVLLICLLCVAVRAQTDANYSMYMRNKLYYNPAYAGMEEGLSLCGTNRMQMRGITNAPSSTDFSISMPVDWLKGGVGMKFATDKYGLFSDLSVNLIYSHKVKIWRGQLGLGMQLGMRQHGFDGSKAKTSPDIGGGTENYHDGSDPLVPSGNEKSMVMDLGIGSYYEDDHLYLGVSVLHIIESQSKLGDVAPTYVPRTVFITGGYLLETSINKLEVQPSAMIKTDFANYQLDVNVCGIYDKQFWAGLGYRWNNAAVLMLGVDLENGLGIGYSYDMGTSQLISFGAGSQEITVKYRLNIGLIRNRDKYRSIRTL